MSERLSTERRGIHVEDKRVQDEEREAPDLAGGRDGRGVGCRGLGAFGTAQSTPIGFDPAGGASFSTISQFDNVTGNTLAVGATTLIGTTPIGSTTGSFATLFHTRISSAALFPPPAFPPADITLSGAPGTPIYTIVARFNSTATVTGATTVSFGNAVAQAGTFLEIYREAPGTPLPNADTGLGFQTGTLVLRATPVIGSESGGFEVTDASGSVTLDNNAGGPIDGPVNDSPTVDPVPSVIGSGGSALSFRVTDWDPSTFSFAGPIGISLAFTTTNSVPFEQQEPSNAFYGTAGPAGADSSGWSRALRRCPWRSSNVRVDQRRLRSLGSFAGLPVPVHLELQFLRGAGRSRARHDLFRHVRDWLGLAKRIQNLPSAEHGLTPLIRTSVVIVPSDAQTRLNRVWASMFSHTGLRRIETLKPLLIENQPVQHMVQEFPSERFTSDRGTRGPEQGHSPTRLC